jgi:hypothetical protein
MRSACEGGHEMSAAALLVFGYALAVPLAGYALHLG